MQKESLAGPLCKRFARMTFSISLSLSYATLRWRAVQIESQQAGSGRVGLAESIVLNTYIHVLKSSSVTLGSLSLSLSLAPSRLVKWFGKCGGRSTVYRLFLADCSVVVIPTLPYDSLHFVHDNPNLAVHEPLLCLDRYTKPLILLGPATERYNEGPYRLYHACPKTRV